MKPSYLWLLCLWTLVLLPLGAEKKSRRGEVAQPVELSGAAWLGGLESWVLAGDQGGLVLLGQDMKVLRTAHTGKHDFEAVSALDGGREFLVLEEDARRLWRFSSKTLKVGDVWDLDRLIRGKGLPGDLDQFEGMTWVDQDVPAWGKGPFLLLAWHTKDAVDSVLQVYRQESWKKDGLVPVKAFGLDTQDAADLSWDPDHALVRVLCDKDGLILEYSPQGRLMDKGKFKGHDMESLSLGPGGLLRLWSEKGQWLDLEP